jgi:segregation and condensation protein B
VRSLSDDDRAEASAIEAVLLVATEPVTSRLLSELLEASMERVEELIEALQLEYEQQQRGFELVNIAGGYRLQSHPAYAGYVERFVLDDAPQRLSPAALETLAIIAYKQPISRNQIAQIRGVNADGVVRHLQLRGYIEPVGNDDGPGLAVLFGTTTLFLERLGLADLAALPPLETFVPDADTVELLENALRPGPE